MDPVGHNATNGAELAGAKGSLAVTLALLALALAAAQWGGFERSVLAGGDRLMTKYESLRLHVERDGPHDLIVLGDSVASQGVNAPRLMAALERSLGRPVSIYNFGAGGMIVPTLPTVSELALGVDRPSVALVVLTEDLVCSWGERKEDATRFVRESPYGRAIDDPVRWRGRLTRWTLDHVEAFALRYRLRKAWLGEPRIPRPPGTYDEGRGFYTWPQRPRTTYEHQLDRDRANRWDQGEWLTEALVELVEGLLERGVQPWLVEAPLHPERALQWPELGVEPGVLARTLRTVSARTGVPALLLPADYDPTPAEFCDARHTNAQGSERFTAWIAEQLGPQLGPVLEAARQTRSSP